MSTVIRATCLYCGDESRFSEAWIAKMYDRCKKCNDKNLKFHQIDLNDYYGGQTVTQDPPAQIEPPLEAKAEEKTSTEKTVSEDYFDYLDYIHD